MKEERISFPSGSILLEGLLAFPSRPSLKGGMVLCHPHPLYGGEMRNQVLFVAHNTALDEGFATLRFNFRGVGGSGGVYDEGVGEQEDVRSAIEYLTSQMNQGDVPILLVGYSFGAWVGLPVAMEMDQVRGMVAISPPLEIWDFNDLKECEKEKLIIGGDKDDFCPISLLKEWFGQLKEPKSLSIIQGADHFYSFHAYHIAQPLREFLKHFKG